MGYIKELKIIGFKKFKNYQINFNEGTNILVGENESGKSTIIEAIDILINKTYENFDKYILAELFNSENVNNFASNLTFETLPIIDIIGEFSLSDQDKHSKEFYGINWKDTDKKTQKYGIWFQCKIDKEYKSDTADLIKKGVIPYEYYSLTWLTFKNERYDKRKKTLKFVPIDSSNSTSFNALDFYSKRLFLKKYEDTLTTIKTDFRTKINQGFSELKLENLEDKKKFALNHKKLILENIVGITDNDILIENRGRGEEKIIKTNLSLDDKQENDVIAIEEPENNLSHANLRKLISDIESKCKGKQLIITTHNNLIVTGLSIKNVIWISKNDKNTLKDIDNDDEKGKTSDYFKRLENDNLLRFILANKAILVEGATEHLLLPKLYLQKYTDSSLEKDTIDIIACNGLSYKRYLQIAEALEKKVAVLTDNDGKQAKITECAEYNKTKTNINVFVPDNVDDFTWESSIKKSNSALISKIVTIDPKAKYLVHGKELEDKVLAYMLNNKVEVAMRMIDIGEAISIPKHVEELFEWIRK